MRRGIVDSTATGYHFGVKTRVGKNIPLARRLLIETSVCESVCADGTPRTVAEPDSSETRGREVCSMVGISLGVWVSVTIALATFRKFPWRMVPGYIFSQLLGGFIGAALIYANYYHAINVFEGGSVLSLTSNITPIMMHHLRHATLLLLLV
ncbi:hypothetical protein F5877DRAFT_69692 [Lentinula edodes]|nr:hypothetical protein F5877DRAFT_69692 [Lentinula edodes]